MREFHTWIIASAQISFRCTGWDCAQLPKDDQTLQYSHDTTDATQTFPVFSSISKPRPPIPLLPKPSRIAKLEDIRVQMFCPPISPIVAIKKITHHCSSVKFERTGEVFTWKDGRGVFWEPERRAVINLDVRDHGHEFRPALFWPRPRTLVKINCSSANENIPANRNPNLQPCSICLSACRWSKWCKADVLAPLDHWLEFREAKSEWGFQRLDVTANTGSATWGAQITEWGEKEKFRCWLRLHQPSPASGTAFAGLCEGTVFSICLLKTTRLILPVSPKVWPIEKRRNLPPPLRRSCFPFTHPAPATHSRTEQKDPTRSKTPPRRPQTHTPPHTPSSQTISARKYYAASRA